MPMTSHERDMLYRVGKKLMKTELEVEELKKRVSELEKYVAKLELEKAKRDREDGNIISRIY